MKNKLIRSIQVYPQLREKFMAYIEGVQKMPAGYNREKLFWDYISVRFKNPGRRVSMSEYMIFGFYNIAPPLQQGRLNVGEVLLLDTLTHIINTIERLLYICQA